MENEILSTSSLVSGEETPCDLLEVGLPPVKPTPSFPQLDSNCAVCSELTASQLHSQPRKQFLFHFLVIFPQMFEVGNFLFDFMFSPIDLILLQILQSVSVRLPRVLLIRIPQMSLRNVRIHDQRG